MTNRVYDYVYFTLFHCELKKLPEISRDMMQLELPVRKKCAHENLLKKVVLFFFVVRCDAANIFILWFYRVLQKCKHVIFARK